MKLDEVTSLEAELRCLRRLRLEERQAYCAAVAHLRRTMSEEVERRASAAYEAEYRAIRRDRDQMRGERDELARRLETVDQEREALACEREELRKWRAVLERDHAALVRMRDKLVRRAEVNIEEEAGRRAARAAVDG